MDPTAQRPQRTRPPRCHPTYRTRTHTHTHTTRTLLHCPCVTGRVRVRVHKRENPSEFTKQNTTENERDFPRLCLLLLLLLLFCRRRKISRRAQPARCIYRFAASQCGIGVQGPRGYSSRHAVVWLPYYRRGGTLGGTTVADLPARVAAIASRSVACARCGLLCHGCAEFGRLCCSRCSFIQGSSTTSTTPSQSACCSCESSCCSC